MVARMLCALLFVAWVGEPPREIDSVLYYGLWRSPFEVFGPLFVPVPGIHLFGWQLLLLALVPVCLATPNAFRQRARELDAAILASIGCIAITFLWGWFRGGGPYDAYYQLWRFLTGLLVAYLLTSVIRTPRDLRALALTIVAAALIRGTCAIYFYWAYVHGRIGGLEYLTNHDDSLLFVAAIVIVGCWAMVKGGGAAWTVAAVVSMHQLYAIVVNGRRLAWVELGMAMIAVYILIGPGAWRRRIHRWLMVAVPVVLLYVAVGWGQHSPMFAPVRALSSVGSNTDASSLARLEEIRNLLYTMFESHNPLLGTGWGIPYQKVTSIYANYSDAWVLALYTPHNSLLGLTAFAGFLGIFGIWGVVPVAAYLAALGYRRSAQPIQRTATMVAIAMLAAYSAHAYGDIGLQSFQCCLLLGIALAAAGKVAVWSRAPASTRAVRARSGDAPATRGVLPVAPAALAPRMGHASGVQRTISTAANAAPRAGQIPTRRARP